jgi:mannosyltransferase
MLASTTGNRRITPGIAVAALMVFVLGIFLRIVALGREGLWMDEIYSATFAAMPFVDTLVAVLRFDVHPPLYYLQLGVWSAMGHSDRWLTLNSVLWSAATLLAVFLGTARRFGARAGLLALGFCVVMGSELYFAEQVRMYSLLSCLAVLSWIAADRVREDYRFVVGMPMLLLLILLTMVHSLSLIAISAVLLYIFPYGDTRRLLRTWTGFAAIAGAALLPWLVIASLRHPHPAPPLSAAALEQTAGGWVLGYGDATLTPWVLPFTFALIAVLLATVLLTARWLSRVTCCFLLWPLLFGALLHIVIYPIWFVDRTFPFCAPFLAIVGGALVGRAIESGLGPNGAALRYSGIGIICGAFTGLAWLGYVQGVTPHKMHYREASAYLRQQTRPGELIYAPELATFWGIARYLIDTDWGNALRFQDPSNPDQSTRWPRIYARLGTSGLQLLHLAPETRRLDGPDGPLIVGWTAFPELQTTASYWVIVNTGVNLSDLHLCTPRRVESVPFGRQIDTIAYTGLVAHHVHCNIDGMANQ